LDFGPHCKEKNATFPEPGGLTNLQAFPPQTTPDDLM